MLYLVEDNDSIREACVAYLRLKDFEVREFSGVTGVLEAMTHQTPELCILDVMLPDGNGFQLAKSIQERYPQVPFLFLSAKESEADRITGLEIGADDYIVKPFSNKELTLRIQAILRRTKQSPLVDPSSVETYTLSTKILELSEENHLLKVNGEEVRLTTSEWRILVHLVRHPAMVVTRDRILRGCLDYVHDGSDRTVNTHLKNLRLKLGPAEWIETVRGFGYRFGAPKAPR